MATKKILGLDLGTNSIGWAVVNRDDNEQTSRYIGIQSQGVRILPMDAAMMGDFENGNSVSQTKDRTLARGVRRLFERRALRRERLNRVLRIMGFLPPHYADQLNRYGQIKKGMEPKLAWDTRDGKTSFLFSASYQEMLKQFSHQHPELTNNGKKIAYDWTIYYLRKKALHEAITKQELAWILLQFNQKRGYNQARGEEEEKNNEKKEFVSLRVMDVQPDNESKGKTWYNVVLENGWVYHRPSSQPLDNWIGKTKDFIVTTKLDENGEEVRDKEGNIKRTFRAPAEDDWGLIKVKTEQDIAHSGKTVGEFIWDTLMAHPDQKIIGQLVRVVDRKFYKEELVRILTKQCEFIPELRDRDLYQECIEALYPQNLAYRQSIADRDFIYLLTEDLVFYQRPLKSKKSLINECALEYRKYRDEHGEWHKQYIKCISKSHPLYEEFRAWQFIENLHLYHSDGLHQSDCTADYIKDKNAAVRWLLTLAKVNQKSILEHFIGKKPQGYSWNYPEDKEYPSAPTTSMLTKLLEAEAHPWTQSDILHLWHILYSVSDKAQLEQAIVRYASNKGLSDTFVEKLRKAKPFPADYGAYSEKAIRKLLALMRSGEAWSYETIDEHTRQRIEHILSGEDNPGISIRVREKLKEFTQVEDFQGLPLWLAEYVVYDIKGDNTKWTTPDDIDTYLQKFRLHSLNNPIVEQVVKECLRTVRDIWRAEGHIDEIHLEMGRDLKQNAEQRKNTLRRQMQNEQANLRAKMLLQAFMNPELDIEGVRPSSPSQLEILRIYEDGVLSAQSDKESEDIKKMISGWSTIKQPSMQDIKKYRLWLDQKYISPYTGEIIPLGKLFTAAYQIEHIIPQSRYFDDAMSNKVICEAEVNELKSNMLGHEFIMKKGGEHVTLTGGKVVTVLTQEAYENLVKELFKNDRAKKDKLMLDEIPEKFVARQMNDSRYISRLMKGLLSNIVREIDPLTHEYEREETSRNLITCTGSVTDRLKKDWGINDAWNHIILPRFERLNQILDTTVYTRTTDNGHTIPTMPIEQQAGFNKKRIDHRHHAMDAIVIACTTRDHVNLLSNESALDKDGHKRYDLQYKLREQENWTDKDGRQHTSFTTFIKPWDTYTQDVENALKDIIVSFKQNLRVINKSTNHYTHFENGKKVTTQQAKGDNWAIRKSLHKDTVFGLVNLRFRKTERLSQVLPHLNDVVDKDLRAKLRELVNAGFNEKRIKDYFLSEKDTWQDINLQKIEVWYYTLNTNDRYYATRTAVNEQFTEQFILNSVTDTGIQKILLAHLYACDGKPDVAFSPDGIDEMNRNIRALNGGVPHKPIYKVRKYEKADKFAIGQTGNKTAKYVEADKGTNLFFAIYVTRTDAGVEKRSFVTIPLKVMIDCQKEGRREWKPLLDQWVHAQQLVPKEAQLAYIISPGDLVYLPTEEEQISKQYSWRTDRIYKMVSSSGSQCFFIPFNIASLIVNNKEFTSLNKMERATSGEMIKETCIPIRLNRLGQIW